MHSKSVQDSKNKTLKKVIVLFQEISKQSQQIATKAKKFLIDFVQFLASFLF